MVYVVEVFRRFVERNFDKGFHGVWVGGRILLYRHINLRILKLMIVVVYTI